MKIALLLACLLALTASALANQCWDGTDGAVSWVTMNSTMDWGNYANDSCGLNNADNYSTSAGAEGKYDEAHSFDGSSSQYMSMGNSTALSNGNFSFCAWFNSTEDTALWGVGTYRRIANKYNPAVGYEWSMYYYVNGLGTWGTSWYILNPTAAQECNARWAWVPDPRIWYHVCGTWNDITRNCTLYINGAYNASAVNAALAVARTQANLTIGSRQNSNTTTTQYFNGTIDEAVFFNYTLTSAEVQNIYAFNDMDTPTSIWINAYDEQHPATNLTFNVTLWNATVTYTSYNNAGPFILSNASATIPQGAITIEASADGWSTRRYYDTWSPTSSGVNRSAYLLASGSGVTAEFLAATTLYAPIPNALITFYRTFANATTSTVIAQRQTDSFGKTWEYLDPYTTYTLVGYHATYGTATLYLAPLAMSYWIIFGTNETLIEPYNPEDFFYALLQPSGSGLVDYNNDSILFEINDPQDSLDWYALNLTLSNGTAITGTNISGIAGGGVIEIQLNPISGSLPADPMDYFVANGSWSRNGTKGSIRFQYRNKATTDTTTISATLISVASMIGSGTGNNGAITILAIFIIITIIGALSNNQTAGFGGGIIALIVGAAFAIYGWIPMTLYIFAASIALFAFLTYARRF